MSHRRVRSFPWPVAMVAAILLVASLTQTELWPTPVAAGTLPTGTFSKGGPIGNCPANHDCTSFTVSGCTNVSKAQDGVIAHAKAIGPARGMAVIFSGGGGTIFWSTDNIPADTLIEDVRQAGLDVVQIRWTRAWTLAEPGEIDAGAAHVACRPTTAVKWIHDNLYAGLNVPSHGVGACGFCVTGTSGGSSQAAYTVSHYGLEGILDAVIPVSGPTHAAMAKGCLRRAGEQDYWYSGASTRNIDYTYGFTGAERPCEQNSTDPLWKQRWDRESVDTQGSDYNHPQTRVHLILGGDDRAMQAHGGDYFNRLQAGGSPLIRMEVVPGMPHAVTQSTAGMEAMTAALIGDNPPPPPPPPPPPTSAVTNGGFENGLTGWSAMSATAVSSPTRNGSAGAARLGGSVSASTGLIQGITVPTGGQLELWVRIDGPDSSTADTLRVQTGSGRYYETRTMLTSAGTHGTWTQVKADLSALGGQTTNLRLLTFNDATNPTTFYVDDVSLVAGSGEQPPPPPPPALTITDLRVNEGNSSTTTATFTISLSTSSTSTVTVNWATANGTATAGEDYVANSGTLSFSAGQTTKTVAVIVNGDTTVEPDETFVVNLSGASGATIGDDQGVGTIANDDATTTNPPPPPPSGSVVTNGDFSNGLNGWTTYGTWVQTPARSNPGAVRLGGGNSAGGGLQQGVTVPTNGQLEAWVWVEGAETSGADKLELQVGSGRSYQTFPASTITSAAARGTWHRVTADLTAHAGQSPNLRFLWTNDAAAPTTFYLDDISLVAG